MLDGVLCMMDDIIVFGDSREKQDTRVKAVLKRLKKNGVTLNFGKCDFAKSSVSGLSDVVSAQGIEVDPAKLQAIIEMEQPTNVGDIRRFLGMANQLGTFLLKLPTITKPLSDFLSKEISGHGDRDKLTCLKR